MTQQSSITRARVQELLGLAEKATPGPWEFRHGHDREGDSCDLLMAEIGRAAEDEDPEYDEVLAHHGHFGETQVSANWTLACEARNALPTALQQLQKAMEKLREMKRMTDQHYSGTALYHEAAALLREYFGPTKEKT